MVETDFLHNYKAIKSRSSVILMKEKEKSNRPWLKIENGVTLILIRPDSWELALLKWNSQQGRCDFEMQR